MGAAVAMAGGRVRPPRVGSVLRGSPAGPVATVSGSVSSSASTVSCGERDSFEQRLCSRVDRCCSFCGGEASDVDVHPARSDLCPEAALASFAYALVARAAAAGEAEALFFCLFLCLSFGGLRRGGGGASLLARATATAASIAVPKVPT